MDAAPPAPAPTPCAQLELGLLVEEGPAWLGALPLPLLPADVPAPAASPAPAPAPRWGPGGG
eukprot:CAMPEP_0202884616 /NCGR_PEP_ID=MMETSP1391-20130828/41207_1 /ASSEMBLY_ACC=CAM_ASM_000867 /TAXON_ID=1034604 /ORGANISM="Chlamydomonas leiostraca, Strain SAG 11-49" /LENGTH=61 /DNA_ID=CAMNT_0049567835 /DNA_START=83 /DNA_END=264 /DNA_ORIENTATION=+